MKYIILLSMLLISDVYADDIYEKYEPVIYVTNNMEYVNGIPSKYEKMILNESNKIGIDPALVKAIIHIESKFNSKAVSSKGAIGLMQLMPSTAHMYGVNGRIPKENIRGGLLYLKDLLDKYDLRNALIAYNGGEGVLTYRTIPTETKLYVVKVLRQYRIYKGWN